MGQGGGGAAKGPEPCSPLTTQVCTGFPLHLGSPRAALGDRPAGAAECRRCSGSRVGLPGTDARGGGGAPRQPRLLAAQRSCLSVPSRARLLSPDPHGLQASPGPAGLPSVSPAAPNPGPTLPLEASLVLLNAPKAVIPCLVPRTPGGQGEAGMCHA